MFERKMPSIKAWLRDACARMALRCTNTGLVNRRLMRLHEKALSRQRDGLPRLSGIDLEIVEGLRRDGIYITTLAALGLGGAGELLEAGQALGAEFAEDARRQVDEGIDFSMISPAAVASHPAIFSWGLNDRLLDIVEAYLGVSTGYDGVTLMYTKAGARVRGPRQWHRDWEDRRTIKIGIYCTDVTALDGPFQMIRRRDPQQGGHYGYRYVLADQAILARKLGADYESDLLSCEGPAGTVFFCETAEYFHRGKPVEHNDRIALFYSYFARRPRHPFYCERSGMSRSQIAVLAKPLSPRQQASALWRQGLPIWLRLIPPASL